MKKSRSNVQRHNHTENQIVKYKGSKIANLQNFLQNCNKYRLENTDSGRWFFFKSIFVRIFLSIFITISMKIL